MAGTVEWCQLEDDDPRKLAAVFDAARHHVLRVDAAQHALIQAGEAISDSADWSAAATTIHRGGQFYAERPWLKREAA